MDDRSERPKWKEHERIWLSPSCDAYGSEGCASERTWCQDDTGPCDECGLDSVEFVLADKAAPEIARLREERDAAEAFGSLLKTQRDDADRNNALLRARVEELTAALEFYAVRSLDDGGETARAALDKFSEEKL